MPKETKTPFSLFSFRVRGERAIKERRYEGHAYLNPDGSVDGEKLLTLVTHSPGGLDMIMLSRMVDRGTVGYEYYDVVREIVGGLFNLVMFAAHGDEQSATQIKAIQKLVKPERYGLPLNKIRDIVERYETSPPLARGWELLRIMSHLAHVVEPLKEDQPYSHNQPIKLREAGSGPFHGDLWMLAQKHWKPHATLQSLAIRIYLESLQKKGITDEGEAITDRSLKRDLEKVREWERNASDDEKLRRGKYEGLSLGGDPITWYDFSEGWKERRVKRKESAKGSKKRNRLT